MRLFGVACSALLASAVVSVTSSAAAEPPPLIQDDLDRESLRAAIERSREFLGKLPDRHVLAEQPRKVTVRGVKETLSSFLAVLGDWDRPQKLGAAIRSRFDLVPSSADPGARELLVTGYYQPIVDGSLAETAAYRYPIYRKPDDLVGVAPRVSGEKNNGPYLSRREIDVEGRLRGKGYEIAWLKDAIDVFFLHIQGSGLIRLEGGRTIQVNYAASNGRPYTSIGKLLLDGGRIRAEESSAPALKKFLADHPDERDEIFARNERYVFFRVAEGGPFGSLGVPVTAGRTVAADPAYFPRGALALLTSRRPVVDAAGSLAGWQPFSRFVLGQDAGSAIRGPGRLDLYFGTGDEAGQAAGFMKSGGRLYFVLGKMAGGK